MGSVQIRTANAKKKRCASSHLVHILCPLTPFQFNHHKCVCVRKREYSTERFDRAVFSSVLFVTIAFVLYVRMVPHRPETKLIKHLNKKKANNSVNLLCW